MIKESGADGSNKDRMAGRHGPSVFPACSQAGLGALCANRPADGKTECLPVRRTVSDGFIARSVYTPANARREGNYPTDISGGQGTASGSMRRNAALLTETILLGNLAVWADGKDIEWDSPVSVGLPGGAYGSVAEGPNNERSFLFFACLLYCRPSAKRAALAQP